MPKSIRGLAGNSGHHALNGEGSGMPRFDGGRSRASFAQSVTTPPLKKPRMVLFRASRATNRENSTP